ncbi:MAG: PaaI family thioesterase [Chloroflexi bacterium]|nr:PaaI family thioesterase [Chloroflexota bacterium]
MNQQPNSKMCFVCGLENPSGLRLRFYDNGKDEVAADFTVQPNHQGYPDVAHGGIVAAILDEAGGRTVMAGDPVRFFMTAKIEIRYRRPVPVGLPLKAVGRLVKLRDRHATATAEIRGAAGEVLAEADLVLTMPPDGLLNTADAERLGWRVYE